MCCSEVYIFSKILPVIIPFFVQVEGVDLRQMKCFISQTNVIQPVHFLQHRPVQAHHLQAVSKLATQPFSLIKLNQLKLKQMKQEMGCLDHFLIVITSFHIINLSYFHNELGVVALKMLLNLFYIIQMTCTVEWPNFIG